MTDKKALLVIDLQNDYLWEKRKQKFTYKTNELIENVNQTIADYKSNGYDIIYIAQVFPNIFTNRLILGFSIKGTEGAKFYKDLKIVSDLYFEKNLPDAFSSKQLKEYINSNGYDEIALCGIDECGCVGATAFGAIKSGKKVKLIKSSTASCFPENKITEIRNKLIKSGVEYI